MTVPSAAETALPAEPFQTPETSTYAVEVVASHSADALLRVLNPLQKLDITPHSVRAGRTWSGDEMMIEVQFDASADKADQARRQMASSILVERVDLMTCSR